MDASANLWADTKVDTVSAVFETKDNRTPVTQSFWKREILFSSLQRP